MERKTITKIITIIVLIIAIIITCNIPKLFASQKEETLPEVKLKEINKNKTFAIMVSNDTRNGYTTYNGNKWPTSEDDYYYNHAECIDNKSNIVKDAIKYNEEENIATLTSNSTIYCTLYFDKYNYMYVPTHQITYDDAGNTTYVSNYMSIKVKKVEFVDNIDTSKATERWDLSDTSKSPSGSVIAWMEPIDNNHDTLYIGSKTKIRATSLAYAFIASEYNNSFTEPISNLESINFNNKLDTSKTTNLYDIFAGNINLTKIIGLENLDVSKATSIQGMFYNCENLSDINLNNWNTSSLITIKQTFFGCKKINNINFLSSWDVSNVVNMVNTFHGISATDFTPIKDWNVSKVTIMDFIFWECTNLKSIDLSNWKTTSLESMRNMFWNCNNAQNINLSNFATSKVTNMYRLFDGCSNLLTIDMRNATFNKVENYTSMFTSVPSNATLIVKDQSQKEWIQTKPTFSGTIKLSSEV